MTYISDPFGELPSVLANVDELLGMKNPKNYTVIESAVYSLIRDYVIYEGWED